MKKRRIDSVTVCQAAEILEISENQLSQMIYDGKIKVFYVVDDKRIPNDEIVRLKHHLKKEEDVNRVSLYLEELRSKRDYERFKKNVII